MFRRWEPPTSEHEALKTFMVEQLNKSIDFDCNDDYYRDKLSELKQPASGKDWKFDRLKLAIETFDYYKEQNKKAINYNIEANKWIKDLKNSLKEFENGS